MSWTASCVALSLVSCAGPASPRAAEPRAHVPHEAPGRTFGPECGHDPACQAERLLAHLLLTAEELGPDMVLADYGTPNPGCWTQEDAPPGPARRLRGVLASGAGAGTRVCYFEYVRRGTHDDVLVKVFLFASPAEAERALRGSYLGRKAALLAEFGLGPPTRRDNVVFYVIGSESNFGEARRIHRLVERRLSGAAAP